jgi:3-phenylpropionate/trans-cinnamate dioxygenase ferredoxin reductase subunit
MIRERVPVDAVRLRDPDVPLEEIARARTAPDQGRVKTVFAQGLAYTRHMLTERFTKADATPVNALPPGEGRVLQIEGEKTAVFRDDDGALHAVSAVCTHMGCLVDFNAEERTWDCPCHGSRFGVDGQVIKGPAKRDLQVKVIGVQSPPEAA